MLEPDELPMPIEIVDSETGQKFRIETKSSSEAHKTLGCMEAPDGNYREETKRLQQKAKGFARRLNGARINKQDACTLYFTMIKPSMLYSAPAGTLDLEEATAINTVITQSILSSMGYCPTTPLAIVYGPKELGGIGLSDIFVEQTVAKALFTIRHIRAQTKVGKALETQLQWAQTVAGTSAPILREPKTWIPQLDGEKWIQTLREGLVTADCGIEIPTITTVKKKRENDIVLMDNVNDKRDKRYNPTDLTVQRVNRCRMFLTAETLADLCDATGTRINYSALHCNKDWEQGTESGAWPRQTMPGDTSRAAWTEFLKRFCKDQSLELLQPLGRWKSTKLITKKMWPFILDVGWQRLYALNTTSKAYDAYKIESETRRGWLVDTTKRATISDKQPQGIPMYYWRNESGSFVTDPFQYVSEEEVKPTDLVDDDNDLEWKNCTAEDIQGSDNETHQEGDEGREGGGESGTSGHESSGSDTSDDTKRKQDDRTKTDQNERESGDIEPDNDSSDSETSRSDSSNSRAGFTGNSTKETFDEYTEYKYPHLRDLCQRTGVEKGDAKTERLIDHLNDPNKTVTIVSDGGVRQGVGGFGWVIAHKDQVLWGHKGRARGQDINSYRAEAYGMMSWMGFLSTFQQYTGVKIRCRIQSFCDNEALVKEAKWTNKTWASECLKPEFDMVAAIRAEGATLSEVAHGLELPDHVKGHQDRVSPWEKLPLEAKLNVAADKLATEAISKYLKKDEQLEVITNPYCRAYLLHNTKIVTREESKVLKIRLAESRLITYHCKRLGIPETTLRDVNWAELRLAHGKLSTSERHFATKMFIGWLGTGKRTHKYDNGSSDCHRCGVEETTNHIMQCPMNIQEKKKRIEEFEKFLGKINTTEEIVTPLVEGLRRWMFNETQRHWTKATSNTMGNASRMQGGIGWEMFARGWLSNEWAKVQEHKVQGRSRHGYAPGDTWSSQVSTRLIRTFNAMWTARNNARHEVAIAENGARTTWANEDANEKIRNIYARVLEVGERDRDLFNVPIGTRLAWNTKQKNKWAKTATRFINQKKEEHDARTLNRQPDIREAFDKARTQKPAEQANVQPQAAAAVPNEDAIVKARQAQEERNKTKKKAWGSLTAPKPNKKKTKELKRAEKDKSRQMTRDNNDEAGEPKEQVMDMVGQGRKPKFKEDGQAEEAHEQNRDEAPTEHNIQGHLTLSPG